MVDMNISEALAFGVPIALVLVTIAVSVLTERGNPPLAPRDPCGSSIKGRLCTVVRSAHSLLRKILHL